MRGIAWTPGTSPRCGRCGSYEVELLADGRGRCGACGLIASMGPESRYAGAARMAGVTLLLFAALVAGEAAAAFVASGGLYRSFVGTFSLLAFATGFAGLLTAGAWASPGRLAVREQRRDRNFMDQTAMGTLSGSRTALPTARSGAGPVVLGAASGALLLISYALNLI